MLRYLSIGLLLGFGLADDEASFIQSGTRSETRLVSTAVEHIKSSLQDIKLQDPERMLLVKSLASTLTSVDKMDDESREILQNVTLLLESIENEMELDRDRHQDLLNGITDILNACNNDQTTADGDAAQEVAESAFNHTACRTDQVDYASNASTKCGELETSLAAFIDLDCQLPDTNGPNAPEDWDLFFTTGLTTFSGWSTTFSQKEPPCTQATNDLHDKIDACNTLQTTFETHYCNWRTIRLNRCATLATCFSDAMATHSNRSTTLGQAASARYEEGIMIERIICLITNVLAAEPSYDLTACEPSAATEAALEARYKTSAPDVPTEDSCDTAEVNTTWPSVDGWHEAQYSELHATTPAKVDNMFCP